MLAQTRMWPSGPVGHFHIARNTSFTRVLFHFHFWFEFLLAFILNVFHHLLCILIRLKHFLWKQSEVFVLFFEAIMDISETIYFGINIVLYLFSWNLRQSFNFRLKTKWFVRRRWLRWRRPEYQWRGNWFYWFNLKHQINFIYLSIKIKKYS